MRQIARDVVANNPRVQAQRQVVAQLRARVAAAKSGYLPSVEGSAVVERRRLNTIGAAGDQAFTLGQGAVEARLPVADGGRTAAAVKTARAELENGEAILDGVINETLLGLVTAIEDVRRSRAIRQLVRQQHDAIAEELKATRRRLDLHDATATDIAQAEARLAAADAALLDAEEQTAASLARYVTVSGGPIAEVPPSPDLPVGPPTLDDAKTRAMKGNPTVRAAQSAVLAGRGTVDAARADLAPSVELVGGYQYLAGGVANLFTGRLPSDRSATYFGAEARIPIFQRGAEYAEIRRARALTGQREYQVHQAVREVTRDVEIAWERTRAARAIATASRAAVTANEAAVLGVTREAGLGARTTLDVLNAQGDLLDAQIILQRALASEVQARASLLSSLGLLADALIGEERR